LTNVQVARPARLSERRFGNYTTDTREPDLQTLVTLARVLAITVGELLGVVTERTGMDRDRLLAQNEAALSQISDSELEMISVQLRAVAEWRKI